MASSSESRSVSVEDEDPYSPLSIDDYYREETQAGTSAPRRTPHRPNHSSFQSTQAAEQETASQPSTGPQESYNQQNAQQEEPLFGGYRTSNRMGANARLGGDPSGNGTPREAIEDEEEERDSYYALLNVQKEATDDDIRDSYRLLAVALHPDKHTSPELKQSAENRFRSVQQAYEVLIDPEKRAIYDHFGARGLSQNWSLVQRSAGGGPRTAAELRDEWERIARRKRAEEVENMIRSKGEYTANLDASALFCKAERVPRSKAVLQEVGRELVRREKETGIPIKDGDTVELPPVQFSERWSRVGLTTLMGRHGWETPLTGYSRLLFQGQMVSKGGMGGGNLNGTLRTQWSGRFLTEFSSTLIHPRVTSFKGQYELSQFSFITFVATATTPVVPPQLNVTYGQRIAKSSGMMGFTSLKSGTYTIGQWGKEVSIRQETPSINVGISKQGSEGRGWTCSTSIALENQGVMVDYGFRPSMLGSPKIRLGLTVGTGSGLAAYEMIERKITENVRLGVGVNFGIPLGGVTLRLRFSRLGQKLNIPIIISPEFRPDLVTVCTVVPTLGLLAAEHLYFKPAKRRKIQDRLVSLRTQHADLIQERREAALEAVRVLRQSARKKARNEWRNDGFVVVEAYYGKRDRWPHLRQDQPHELYASVWDEPLEDHLESAGQDDQDWWDVTIPVMMLVQKGQLIIAGGRQKHKLLGFFDPCMGERKHLVVRYLFRGRLHHVVVDDVTQLTAPLRAHQLS